MPEKIKKYLKLIAYLRDVRFIGLGVFAMIGLLVAWSTLGAIQVNYELQQQIARLEEQNKIHELENSNLRLRKQYYETEQYLELTARRQFSKGAEGETLVLVPRSVALAKTVDLPDEYKEPKREDRAPKPSYQRNFEAWMRFFFRHTPV